MAAQPIAVNRLADAIDAAVAAVEPQLIAWRRDVHAHPELGNREVRTAGIVAAHLRSLGFDEVRTEVAVTGVVGLLRGALPGPVVALRADMDGLPVEERTDVPFASKVRTTWNGEPVGVMHACGHDAHVAILMGVAERLAGLRDRLAGSVKFIFQPAEEMPPEGEEGGAQADDRRGRAREPGCRRDLRPARHLELPTGVIGYRAGPDDGERRPLPHHCRAAGRRTARCRGAASTRSSPRRRSCSACRPSSAGRSTSPASRSWSPSARSRAACARTSSPIRSSCAARSAPSTRAMRDDVHERVRDTAEHISRPRAPAARSASPRTTRSPSTTPSSPKAMLPTLERVAGKERVGLFPRSPARRTSRSTSTSCRACSSSSASRRRARPGQRGTESFAALLHRRDGSAARRARARPRRGRLARGASRRRRLSAKRGCFRLAAAGAASSPRIGRSPSPARPRPRRCDAARRRR